MVSARPRERILTTATELFRKDGIGAVGVNRIIREADVAPMTLYRQFTSKDGLVAAALEHWGIQWLHLLAEALDRRGDDPWSRFDGLWDTLEEWVADDGFRGPGALRDPSRPVLRLDRARDVGGSTRCRPDRGRGGFDARPGRARRRG